jgi:hypothetical protein
LKKLLKKFVLDKHNKAKNQINTFTKYIECPQLLKQQLFFIEEKNNPYKIILTKVTSFLNSLNRVMPNGLMSKSAC